MEHYEPCPRDHGDHPCTPIDHALQARYDNDPDFRAKIDSAMAGPVVRRPRRTKAIRPEPDSQP